MIESSEVSSVARKAQTDWDLSSSVTGTVKRRPISLDSCKSNSPAEKDKKDGYTDFPIEKRIVINKENAKNDDNFPPEIRKGNEIKKEKVNEVLQANNHKKIDSPSSIKGRIESAKKSISSKLKLPNSLSHLSPVRKSSLNNKFSLSQLEKQNNLFIRGGQQISRKTTTEVVVNHNNKINKVGSDTKNNSIAVVTMDDNAKGNNFQSSSSSSSATSFILSGNKLDTSTKYKKSLIPSFLSSSECANSNQVKKLSPSSSSFIKAPNVIEKTLTKTGNKFREFYREKQQTNIKPPPPPYRPPPTPKTFSSSVSSTSRSNSNLSKKNQLENYEEMQEENLQNDNFNMNENFASNEVKLTNDEDSNIDIMLAKAEYSSNLFKNIPVRPRKGTVSHMENYCLFDPSVDFCNEKELMKKTLTQSKIPIELAQKLSFNVDYSEERLEDISFDDQTVHDNNEQDDRLAHHNYYEIDPELMKKEETGMENCKKIKMTSSSESSSTNNSASSNAATTTSSSSSSDYPSLFNSVIETTHSSNIESTDDNDSNGYGKYHDIKINQQNVSSKNLITVQNVVTCDANIMIANGVNKKAPQMDRITNSTQSSVSVSKALTNSRNKQCQMVKSRPASKINKFSSKLDSLRQSHSLPQLQKVIVQNRCQKQLQNKCDGGEEARENKNELTFGIENTTTLQFRRQPGSCRQQGRPLSTTSDDRDSGFLSPATPPDCQNATQNTIEHENTNNSDRTKTESSLLSQCVSIQQLIEIYTQWANYYLERAKAKRRINDLSSDCRDGLLLADVIEAVTNFKVPDLTKKPKTQQQMLENIEACLNILRKNDIEGLESISASDICSGRLKAVLSLFFSLSRYKQVNKLITPYKSAQTITHQAQIHQSVQSLNSSQGDMRERQLPVPITQKNGNGTAIPSSITITKKCSEKIPRSLPVANGQNSMIRYPSGTPSSENSRPNSPPGINRGSGLRYHSISKTQPSSYNCNEHVVIQENIHKISQQQTNPIVPAKQSMLDKLKLFNKDKDRSKSSKRTSSSSGFSSARSDSSLSLNNDSTILHTSSKAKKNEITTGVTKSTQSNKSSKILINNSSKISKENSITSLTSPIIKSQSKSDKKKNVNESNFNNVDYQQSTTKYQQKLSNEKHQSQNVSQQNDSRIKQQQQQAMLRKIEIQTDTKTALSPQPKLIMQPTTSIPKPMAAIKGTSKLQTLAIQNHDPANNLQKSINTGRSNSSLNFVDLKTQIVNPLQSHLRDTNGHIHVSLQSMTDSINSNSTNNHSNSSDSSVIYRPSASESGSEFNHTVLQQQQQNSKNLIPNRKVSHFNNDLSLTNEYKFNTIPSKLNGGNTLLTSVENYNQIVTTSFEDQQKMSQQAANILPPRSIMQAYNNQQQHVATLPTRGSRRGQNLVNGYFDEHHNQGYCSDGDALRIIRCSNNIENGYLSEGGSITNPHFMNIFRNRSPLQNLPMTITEERYKSNKEKKLDEANEKNKIAAIENWNQRMIGDVYLRDESSLKTKSRVKGVPQNFGYIKKNNESAIAAEKSTHILINGSRTAAVTAVPRTSKFKTSDGTQTRSNNFQKKQLQLKSCSLNGIGAVQLSQSTKDRFALGTNSLPKSNLDMHALHRCRINNRTMSRNISDGSVSDSYSDIKDYKSYALWLRHSNTSSVLSEGCENDSLENMSIMTRNQKLLHHRNSIQSPVHKLNRSNSISFLPGIRTFPRSTKSEKTYPSILRRMTVEVESEPYYCLPINGTIATAWNSQPTSPTPRNVTNLKSPTQSNSTHRFPFPNKKNDEVHGSQISLISGGSSIYGSYAEEQRQANEVRRLKRELAEAREQVMSLSSQLSTNG